MPDIKFLEVKAYPKDTIKQMKILTIANFFTAEFVCFWSCVVSSLIVSSARPILPISVWIPILAILITALPETTNDPEKTYGKLSPPGWILEILSDFDWVLFETGIASPVNNDSLTLRFDDEIWYYYVGG